MDSFIESDKDNEEASKNVFSMFLLGHEEIITEK